MVINCGKCGGKFTSAAAFRAHGSCIPKSKPKPQPKKEKKAA